MAIEEAFRACLINYFNFSGRATRSEFWWFSIPVGLTLAALHQTHHETVAYWLGLAVLLPSWAVSARRLHDVGLSAWWLLLILVPVLGHLALLVMYLRPGSQGSNRFGLA